MSDRLCKEASRAYHLCGAQSAVHGSQIKSTTGIAFNKAPEMKAYEVADAAVEAYNSGEAS